MAKLQLTPIRVTPHGVTFQCRDRKTLTTNLVFVAQLMVRDFDVPVPAAENTWAECKPSGMTFAEFRAEHTVTTGKECQLLPWDGGNWKTKVKTDAAGNQTGGEVIYGLVPVQ